MVRWRRAALVLTVLAIVAGLGLWWCARRERGLARPVAAAAGAQANVERGSAAGSARAKRGDPAARTRTQPSVPSSRARRDALRARILSSLAAQSSAAPEHAAANGAREADRRDPRDEPGTLVDRAGGRDALVALLNRDFMPLARECIERAHERRPALAGMLALDVQVIADARQGGVVEHARAAAGNQVADADLLECIAQTASTVTFPPPLVSGREGFQLTLRVTPAPDAGTEP